MADVITAPVSTGFAAGIGLVIVLDQRMPRRVGDAPLDEPGPGRQLAPAARKGRNPDDEAKRTTR